MADYQKVTIILAFSMALLYFWVFFQLLLIPKIFHFVGLPFPVLPLHDAILDKTVYLDFKYNGMFVQ